MLKRYRFAVAAALFAAGSAAAIAAPLTYTNARFGTTVTFPDEVFTEQMPEPENGDGATWLAEDGGSVAVWGMNNALEQTPKGLIDEARARSDVGYQVTYSTSGTNWAVLSGFEDGWIFYERFEFGAEDVIHGLLIKYQPSTRAIYDPLVGPIAASLGGP